MTLHDHQRRTELLHRYARDGLSADEARELERLNILADLEWLRHHNDFFQPKSRDMMGNTQ